jgi:tetratricopeptide (TPR) repeat protein
MNPFFRKTLLGVTMLMLTWTRVFAGPADELIAQGDACYDQLRAADALKCYLPAEKLDPKNVRLLVRISREYRHLMSDAPTPDQKLGLGSTALTYAKRAVSLEPTDPEAHLAVAISCGKLQPLESSRERIVASQLIKESADKVIRLDPNSDLGWHVLGRWHMALAEVNSFQRALAQLTYGLKLPESTYEEAAHCFEKAIALNPARLMHYIELGRVYARMGRIDDARAFIAKGLAMRDTEKDDPEIKRQGRELLASLPAEN